MDINNMRSNLQKILFDYDKILCSGCIDLKPKSLSNLTLLINSAYVLVIYK